MADRKQTTNVPWLGPEPRSFEFEANPDDEDVRGALERFVAVDARLREAATPHLIAYCEDILAHMPPEWKRPAISLQRPGDIWNHVSFDEPIRVTRRAEGDEEDGIYFDLMGRCDGRRSTGSSSSCVTGGRS